MREPELRAEPRARLSSGPELSIVVPTFNERTNIEALVARLEDCLGGIAWEVIFVDDDSADATAAAVRAINRRDRRVRCVQRIGRRGLASACIEGMLTSAAPLIAVMDADMQHDERLLPRMVAALRDETLEIVIGSRFAEGGSGDKWSARRERISALATKLSSLVVKAELTDPMSGFFMIRRTVFHELVRGLSGIGFKILLDIFATAKRPLRFRELGYEFRPRAHGTSKLDSRNVWDFFMLLADKRIGRFVPVRFVSFALIGGLGVGVHLGVLALLFRALDTSFMAAQATATLVAMTNNFALNNALTYRDRALHGWRWLRGLASFVAICAVGAFANVGVAQYFFSQEVFWLLSGAAGIVVGVVWNYLVTSLYTWKLPQNR